MERRRSYLTAGIVLILGVIVFIYVRNKTPRTGEVPDEAQQAGRAAESMGPADEDYFHDMDGGLALSREEIKGRNMWLVWTGGNDRFWDAISANSVGILDFLKTISSRPGLKASRDNRWEYLGLVNEPCFEKATGPDPKRFDLWLDKRRSDCPPDPFENAQKYPGVRIGARGSSSMPDVGSYYGFATGIVGLRLFPNPAFDQAAAKNWNAESYYTDAIYYNSKKLIKPYRVGMSCAFCHVGPNPVNPPADPNNPKWENLSSNVGAQYFWVDRIFSWEADPSSFAFQQFHTARPGSLDTSLVSTDYINNPRTMNAVYQLAPRLQQGKRFGQEQLAGGGLNNRQFNDFVKEGPLTEFFQPPDKVWTPHVLKDGADSVGALGALNRVYLNIGLFSEEWLLHFRPLIGGKRTTPIEIAVARKNSAYWRATENQSLNMALFFLKSTAPHHLSAAPGGAAYLTKDPRTLLRGKTVFAEYCARCHSSKGPDLPPEANPGACAGPKYLGCWKNYWKWTQTETFKGAMKKIVLADDFLEDNALTTDLRVPVTLLQTNACSPLASNAIGGSIWDNFSSLSYKNLPSVGAITIYNPISGDAMPYEMPAGGRGYTRPASLVSLWSTAPFLLNNSVGKFNASPSVAARMDSFQDSIEKMLWPEKRDKDKKLGDKVPGLVDRTTARSYLRIPAGYLPDFLQKLVKPGSKYFPWLFKPGDADSLLSDDGGIEIGPIPAGTPVGLISSTRLVYEGTSETERLKHEERLLSILLKAKHDLKAAQGASDEEALGVFANLVKPLMEVSACPDYVVNRGHYFGTQPPKSIALDDNFSQEPGLSDADKRALIEFLKTF